MNEKTESKEEDQTKAERQETKKYDVFWTFVANHADKVKTIEAESVAEAIEKSTFYDPKTKNDHGSSMNFIVWSHKDGLIHEGPHPDLEED